MVLAELGQRITHALASMSAASVIDEAVLDACLKEIATALLQADVNVKLVAGLRNNVKKRVNVEQMAQGLNKQRVIEKVRQQIDRWACVLGQELTGRWPEAQPNARPSAPTPPAPRPRPRSFRRCLTSCARCWTAAATARSWS